MTHQPPRLSAHALVLVGGLGALLGFAACADEDRPTSTSDAAAPVGASSDTGSGEADASISAAVDANVPGSREAGASL